MKSVVLTYCFVLLSSLINTNVESNTKVPSKDLLPKVEVSEVSNELTLKNLYQEMVNQGIKHPDVVLRQAILETGWFKSYSCRKRNNLFGFWYKNKYIVFDSWKESVSYYKEWQDRHYKENINYYDFLVKRGYAEDPKYISKLKAIKIERIIE